ncbi:MAG: redoxin domain-containing protein, partial [Bacteroidota bacterium]
LQFVYKRGFMVDSLKKMIKKGTPEDSVRYTEKIRAIDKEVIEYKDEFIKKHPESFLAVVFRAQTDPVVPKTPTLPNGRPDSTFPYRYFKGHYFDNMKLYDSRLLRTPVYARKLEFYVKNLIVPVPDSVNKDVDDLLFRIRSYMFNPKFRIADSIIFSNEKKFEKYEDNKAKYFKGIPDSVLYRLKGAREMFKYTLWYLTSNYEKSNIMGMDAVFVHLVEKYYATRQAFWVDSAQLVKFMSRAISMDPVLLNRPAAELMLPDTSGQYVSLKQIKTPLVILYFWDPDCGHCTTETPKLAEEYHKLLKEGFDITVYAVYTEKEKFKEWKAFIRKHNLDWINVWDPYDQSGFKKKFDVYSTPVLYLLNEKKEIIAKRLQADQLDNFLKKIYKKK